ncbi:MAG: type II toxin-antitoxin system PemK/MazF family toxin [Candidatus Micrarchaeia archaeon]
MRKGDLCLVRVDFIETSESKVRPAIIISNNSYNKSHPDLIICSVTTNSSHDCFLEIKKADLASGQLYPGSGVRFDSVTRVDKERFGKKIGKVTPEFHSALVNRITALFS